VPQVHVVDFAFNREQTLALWQQASDEGCAVENRRLDVRSCTWSQPTRLAMPAISKT